MVSALDELAELYEDNKACAQRVGLSYTETEEDGIGRVRRGNGFSYVRNERTVTDQKLKKRIAGLVIPPAWQDVWISPDDKAHVLATGTDERGRKQYIYHPKWRTLRDLIKFYRMILFAKALPTIRQTIQDNLRRPQLDREKVTAVMLWLLDNTYIRIGNDVYLTDNDSVGLTTLSDKNLVVAGNVITLSFVGKSGKPQQITFDDARIAKIINELISQRGTRLFRYREGTSFHDITAADINNYLHELTNVAISAKDFRTWGGTLMAFNHLVETQKLPDDNTPKPEKVAVEAVDAAANVLGNTRSIAKSSYVHPHIVQIYTSDNFADYYEAVRSLKPRRGLDKRETELVSILEKLFEKQFSLIKSAK